MYMDQQFWVLVVFMVLMGLSICVHACTWTNVLGFGGFHGFDGQAHQNCENHQNRWSMYMHTDGQAHQNCENCQNPKLVVQVHTQTQMDRLIKTVKTANCKPKTVDPCTCTQIDRPTKTQNRWSIYTHTHTWTGLGSHTTSLCFIFATL